jgi:hypothetical protein
MGGKWEILIGKLYNLAKTCTLYWWVSTEIMKYDKQDQQGSCKKQDRTQEREDNHFTNTWKKTIVTDKEIKDNWLIGPKSESS